VNLIRRLTAKVAAAEEELADIERQPAPSRFDVIFARRALRLAQQELDEEEDRITPPRRLG